MISIFSNIVEDTIEVFIDDFSMVGDSSDRCLNNMAEVFKRCEVIWCYVRRNVTLS